MDAPVEGPRFSPVDSDDRAGQLWIITILSLIYSALVATARAYIKFRMYGLDDLLIASATLLHLGQSVAVFVGLSSGLGKFNSITSEKQWATSSKSFLATEVLCVLALSLAKCSVLALVLRIIGSKTGKSRPFCLGLMGLSAGWGVGACIALLVNCRADTLLTLENAANCPNQETRWAVITAIDIVTELLSWLLVVRLCWTVHMSIERKCQVVLAFSFRLPLIVLSALHLSYFDKYTASAEPQFAITSSLLFQQTMILWSLISATVPNLKNFMKSFSIGMGLPVAFDISGYGSSNVYAMQSLKSKSKATSSAAAGGATATSSTLMRDDGDAEHRVRPQAWRPDQIAQQTTVIHHTDSRPDEEERSSRNGSQELIINKEVVWRVEYEGQRR